MEGIGFCNVEVREVGVIETRTEMSSHAAVKGAVCFAKRHKLSELERGTPTEAELFRCMSYF